MEALNKSLIQLSTPIAFTDGGFCLLVIDAIYITSNSQLKTDTKLRKSAEIQHLSEKPRNKTGKMTTKLQQMKEPDVSDYTKKYNVMEERRLKEGLFPFRKQQTLHFCWITLKLISLQFQRLVAYAILNSTLYKVQAIISFSKAEKNYSTYNGMV